MSLEKACLFLLFDSAVTILAFAMRKRQFRRSSDFEEPVRWGGISDHGSGRSFPLCDHLDAVNAVLKCRAFLSGVGRRGYGRRRRLSRSVEGPGDRKPCIIRFIAVRH